MKKILYTLSMAVAILFTSCAEDRGTSTEVADANKNESVKPSHLNQYNLPGTAGSTTASINDNTNRNAAGTQTEMTAEELVKAYYTNNQPTQYYRMNATQRMGGMAPDANATKTSKSTGTATQSGTKTSTTMAPGSTTASGEGRDAVTSKTQTSGEKKATTTKKKTRLTPEQ